MKKENDKSMNKFQERHLNEIEQIASKLSNLTLILGQTEINLKQRDYLNSCHKLNNRLIELVKELKDERSRLLGIKQRARDTFDINTILEDNNYSVQNYLKEQDIKLVYSVDTSVPAKLRGDGSIISAMLVTFLKGLIYLEKKKVLIVKVFLIQGAFEPQSEDRVLQFRLFYNKQDTKTIQLVKDNLISSYLYKLFEKKIKSLDGSIKIADIETEPLISVSIPVQMHERRSYRLPSKDWMNKKILILISDDTVSNALKDMLKYFHFDITKASSIEDAQNLLYSNRYDMIFIDEIDIDSFQKDFKNLYRNAYIILLTEDKKSQRDKGDVIENISSTLTTPFTQQLIFNTLLDIYSKDTQETKEEIVEVLKENASFLLQGKNILYIGKEDLDQAVVKQLLDSAKINTISIESSSEVVSLIPKVEIIIIGRPVSRREGDILLNLCSMICSKKIVLALLPIDNEYWTESLKEYNIKNLINTPIDPENFYRTILDLILIEDF